LNINKEVNWSEWIISRYLYLYLPDRFARLYSDDCHLRQIIISIIFMLVGSIGALITFISFIKWVFYAFNMVTLIILRYHKKYKDAPRPFKVQRAIN